MSRPYDPPTLGSKLTYDGEDFFAVKRESARKCSPCAFDGEEEKLHSRCSKSACLGIAWVPLNIYITHKLTS